IAVGRHTAREIDEPLRYADDRFRGSVAARVFRRSHRDLVELDVGGRHLRVEQPPRRPLPALEAGTDVDALHGFNLNVGGELSGERACLSSAEKSGAPGMTPAPR